MLKKSNDLTSGEIHCEGWKVGLGHKIGYETYTPVVRLLDIAFLTANG